MGIDVKLTVPEGFGVKLQTAIGKGLAEGGHAILEASNALAPTEPDPRHGRHLTETGFVEIVPSADQTTAVVGYRAFWAVYQHEHVEWEHPHGGEAKFLEKAAVSGAKGVAELVAAQMRADLG